MKSLTRIWRDLDQAPLHVKINLVIAVPSLLMILAVTLHSGQNSKQRALQDAIERTKQEASDYFDGLNVMMLTGTMDQRKVLRTKILNRPGIKEARVIRGQPVKQQFGGGYPEEQPEDEFDRAALKGEEFVRVEVGSDGGRILTVITPFEATESTKGVNCLQCHNVASGSINGAIRITYSLTAIDKRVEQDLWLGATTNIMILGTGLFLMNLLLRFWITRPLRTLMDVVNRRAKGDQTARASRRGADEIARLGQAFNEMAERVLESVQREHDAAEDLRNKVNILLDVVSRAAKGDLSGQVRFGGQDAIGELAQVIQAMINNIRLLLKDKHETVEDLQRRVDRILSVVTRVAAGDLTGRIDVRGDDAIGRLAMGVQSMIDSLNALVAHVQHAGIQVTSSATEIAATAKQQAATMAQQAATVNEIVSTSAQISATARGLLATMNEVAKVAEETTAFAASGQAELSKMEMTMHQVVGTSTDIVSKLEILREKATNINTVVTTITKVADQTNLLSLNAAIEAEKAGEHGLGFAVVATEIRRLADQTAVASWDIEQLITKMQSAVTSGVLGVERFTTNLRVSADEVEQVSSKLAQIIEQVRALTPRFESVREGMQFQSQGAEQIKHGITALNESAQQTVQSLRHSGAAIDNLNEAAHRLQKGVSRFKVLGTAQTSQTQ